MTHREHHTELKRRSADGMPVLGPDAPRSPGLRQTAEKLYDLAVSWLDRGESADDVPQLALFLDGEGALLDTITARGLDMTLRSEPVVRVRWFDGPDALDGWCGALYGLLDGKATDGTTFDNATSAGVSHEQTIPRCVPAAMELLELLPATTGGQMVPVSSVPPYEEGDPAFRKMWFCLTVRTLGALTAGLAVPALARIGRDGPSLPPWLTDGFLLLDGHGATDLGRSRRYDLLAGELVSSQAALEPATSDVPVSPGGVVHRLRAEITRAAIIATCVTVEADRTLIDLLSAEDRIAALNPDWHAHVRAHLAEHVQRTLAATREPGREWTANASLQTLHAPRVGGGEIVVRLGFEREPMFDVHDRASSLGGLSAEMCLAIARSLDAADALGWMPDPSEHPWEDRDVQRMHRQAPERFMARYRATEGQPRLRLAGQVLRGLQPQDTHIEADLLHPQLRALWSPRLPQNLALRFAAWPDSMPLPPDRVDDLDGRAWADLGAELLSHSSGDAHAWWATELTACAEKSQHHPEALTRALWDGGDAELRGRLLDDPAWAAGLDAERAGPDLLNRWLSDPTRYLHALPRPTRGLVEYLVSCMRASEGHDWGARVPDTAIGAFWTYVARRARLGAAVTPERDAERFIPRLLAAPGWSSLLTAGGLSRAPITLDLWLYSRATLALPTEPPRDWCAQFVQTAVARRVRPSGRHARLDLWALDVDAWLEAITLSTDLREDPRRGFEQFNDQTPQWHDRVQPRVWSLLLGDEALATIAQRAAHSLANESYLAGQVSSLLPHSARLAIARAAKRSKANQLKGEMMGRGAPHSYPRPMIYVFWWDGQEWRPGHLLEMCGLEGVRVYVPLEDPPVGVASLAAPARSLAQIRDALAALGASSFLAQMPMGEIKHVPIDGIAHGTPLISLKFGEAERDRLVLMGNRTAPEWARLAASWLDTSVAHRALTESLVLNSNRLLHPDRMRSFLERPPERPNWMRVQQSRLEDGDISWGQVLQASLALLVFALATLGVVAWKTDSLPGLPFQTDLAVREGPEAPSDAQPDDPPDEPG